MASSETTVGGDAQGPVLSGSFGGPVQTGQSVTVTVQQAAQAELPPELQAATLRQMVVGVIAAVQHLEDRIFYAARADAEEREHRIAVVDQQFEEAARERRDLRRWLGALTIAVLIVALGLYVVATRV